MEGELQAEVFKPNGLICLTGWVVVLAFHGSVVVVRFGRWNRWLGRAVRLEVRITRLSGVGLPVGCEKQIAIVPAVGLAGRHAVGIDVVPMEKAHGRWELWGGG